MARSTSRETSCTHSAIRACPQAAPRRTSHARRGARPHAREQSTSPRRRAVVRRPRRLVLLGRRHPQLHQRRHATASARRTPTPACSRRRRGTRSTSGPARARRSPTSPTASSARSPARTSYVTISVGGNDAGFADVLTECAQPGWASDCDGAIDGAQYVHQQHPARPAEHALRRRSAGARRSPRSSSSATRGSSWARTATPAPGSRPAEETRLNQTADLLNSKLSAAASAQGFTFANPTSRFIGHAVCDNPEWINGLSNPISESYHPNRSGHSSGYAPLVSPLLTGAPARITAAVLARGRSSAARPGRAAAPVRRRRPLDQAGAVPGARPAQPARPERPRGRTGST